ncbi:dipeptide ABC transporter ATP-binding protein [Pandoraea anhela]|uniref:dipeptide ABC transporter ATP-binding protein n=1 Tax=Pandoraea anhela TaxID=2508295 RepID=UPI001C2D3FC4|nr:ABC transporter ATP-binding protein [Pandoraea anhela]
MNISLGEPQRPVLRVSDLSIAYAEQGKRNDIVHHLTLSIGEGEAYGLVGESGCGKSTVAMAIMSHLSRNGRVVNGRIEIAGKDVARLNRAELRQLRANDVAMVYQDPGRALNPSLTIGRQMAEAFEASGVGKTKAVEGALDMLRRVRIQRVESVMQSYPHELSGGMQQRIVIAMALAKNPSLLILDEPTTGLDVTIEAEVLDLISALRREFSTGILLISHNLSVVRRVCERIGVLYAGRLVEEGRVDDVLDSPRHPYTAALLQCIPGANGSPSNKFEGRLNTISGELPSPGERIAGCAYAPRCARRSAECEVVAPVLTPLDDARHGRFVSCHYAGAAMARVEPVELAEPVEPTVPPAPQVSRPSARDDVPMVRVRNVSKSWRVKGRAVRGLDEISFDILRGETLGLVGESGSGKTTLAKLIMGMIAADEGGVVEFDGAALASRVTARSKAQIGAMQIVFQNPDSALNRSHSVRKIVARSLTKLSGGSGTAERIGALVKSVRLPLRYLPAKPRQLSGGLKQRVAIARAFAGSPSLVVCDEPTSALDVSVQASILNLLADLQARERVSYLLISHDVNVIRYLADRVAVLYHGWLLEIGRVSDVFSFPVHPYTEVLLGASARMKQGEAGAVSVDASSPMPSDAANEADAAEAAHVHGCKFESRCPRSLGEVCKTSLPAWQEIGAHRIRCHIPLNDLKRYQASDSR